MLGAAVVWYAALVFALVQFVFAIPGGHYWGATFYFMLAFMLALLGALLAPNGYSRVEYDEERVRIKNLFRPAVSLLWSEIDSITHEFALERGILVTQDGRRIGVYLTCAGHCAFVSAPPTFPIYLRQLRCAKTTDERVYAATMLRGPAGEAALLAATNLGSEGPAVRRAAAQALGELWFLPDAEKTLDEAKVAQVDSPYQAVVRAAFESSKEEYEEQVRDNS